MGSGAGGAAGLEAIGLKAAGTSTLGVSCLAAPGTLLAAEESGDVIGLVRESRVLPFW